MPDDSAMSQPPRNRLSIGQLLLWTLGCAVFVAAFRLLPAMQSATESTWATLFLAMWILPVGAQAVGFLLIVYRVWAKRDATALQPGHWLLAAEALQHYFYWRADSAAIFSPRRLA